VNSYWNIYYRGNLGRWVDMFVARKKEVKTSLFLEYLDAKSKLEKIVKEINDLEVAVEKKYPLIKSTPIDGSDGKTYLDELIFYINSKET